ncbi:MAG: hypothetical protein K2G01_03960, partial [Paramuribaculum sp.]|nr:hypothetical protein [Paramuribaculum sp.]
MHATGSIDTLSYAFGHQHTLATLAGNNSLMQTGSDFEDYIRGLEENLRDINHMGDSSYMLSYALGGLEATFIYSGASRAKEEDRPPFPCIIAGLRKVGNNEISLPADTIAAMNTINSLTTENRHQSELDKENACRFFTAYGIMKAFQPGLQQYINEIKPGTKCIANRQAFANGMADGLESATEIPKTAHDVGKIIALSAKLAEIDDSTFDYNSFIAGAKAALGLSDEIIPREAVEQIIDIKYAKYDDTANDVDLEKAYSLLGKLEIEPFTEYSVDWSVTAGPVAGIGTPATDSFFMIMNQLGINENPVNGTLMIHTPDENGSLFDAISSAIRNSPLPDGYKWFCGKTDNNETTVGIMDSSYP